MNIMKQALLVVAFVFAPVAAFAGNYGTAGCGLGAHFMGKDGNQTSAATTNGTAYSQLFGITSGTSECTDGDAAAAAPEATSADQEAFVKHNLASIATDASQGKGEYLAAFATILGCDGSVQPEFFKVAQSNQTLFVPNAEAPVVLTNVKSVMSQNQTLKASCARI